MSEGEEVADPDGFIMLDCEADEEDELYYEENNLTINKNYERLKINNKQINNQRKTTTTTEGAASLADIILAQLKKHEEQHDNKINDINTNENNNNNDNNNTNLSPKVIDVYTCMAPFLARYKSGKLPKAFKIIPRLHSWEEILTLTNPFMWSKQTTRAATKVFCSNLRENMAQRFLCTVLLPAVRDDISQNKKLNYHLYMALKKALFKPGAFFKGIYLPLAMDVSVV